MSPKPLKRLFNLVENFLLSYLASFIAFIVIVVIARSTDEKMYTSVVLGLALGNVLTHFVNMGSNVAFARDSALCHTVADLYWLAMCSNLIKFGVFFVLLIFVFIFSYFKAESFLSFYAFFCFSAWVLLVGLYPFGQYDFYRKTRIINLHILCERVVGFVVCVLFFLGFFEFSVFSASLLFVRFVFIIYMLKYWFTDILDVDFRGLRSSVKCSIGFGGLSLSLALPAVFQALLVYGSQVILESSQYRGDLAAYSFAFQILGFLTVFHIQICRIYLKDIVLSCIGNNGAISGFVKYGSVIVSVSLLATAVCAVAARYGIDLYFSDDRFSQVYKYILFLSLWVALSGVDKLQSQYMLNYSIVHIYRNNIFLFSGVFFVFGLLYIPIYGVASLLVLISLSQLAIVLSNGYFLFRVVQRG